MEDRSPLALAHHLATHLEAAGIPYALGGALCMGTWGYVRATKDVDLNVFVSEDRLADVLPVFAAAGCTFDADEALRRARERGDMVLWLAGVRVDVFTAFHAIHRDVERRRTRVSLPSGQHVWMLSPRDLMLFKVLFGRSKDWVDIERLLRAQIGAIDGDGLVADLISLLGDDPRIARLRSLLEQARGEP
jgi:hypothetical protein